MLALLTVCYGEMLRGCDTVSADIGQHCWAGCSST